MALWPAVTSIFVYRSRSALGDGHSLFILIRCISMRIGVCQEGNSVSKTWIRGRIGRNSRELAALFERFPDASFCLDVGHARQVDTSMLDAYKMLKEFGARLCQIRVSEFNARDKQDQLSFISIVDFQEVATLIPPKVPVIIESVVPERQILAEINRVRRALSVPARAAGKVTTG